MIHRVVYIGVICAAFALTLWQMVREQASAFVEGMLTMLMIWFAVLCLEEVMRLRNAKENNTRKQRGPFS